MPTIDILPAPRAVAIESADLEFFRRNGYLVVPNAIPPDDLKDMLAIYDRDYQDIPFLSHRYRTQDHSNLLWPPIPPSSVQRFVRAGGVLEQPCHPGNPGVRWRAQRQDPHVSPRLHFG